MIDAFTTGALIRVIEDPDSQPITWLRDQFFGFESFSDDEKVFFDVMDKKRRLAPYVSPRVRGKVMEKEGFRTDFFIPPYLKPKGVIEPNELVRRVAGEPMMGSLSMDQRRAITVRRMLQDHQESISRREEVQASEAIRAGQITITGDGYGTVVLSYGRNAGNTVVLAGAARWDQAGTTPLVDIATWARTVRVNSNGAIANTVICGVEAFEHVLARLSADERKDLFDSLRGSMSQVELGPRTAERVRFEGRIGQFSFYTYSDTYHDDDGNSVEVWPTNEVAVVSGPEIEGTRAYAAIKDGRAGYRPLRRFPKMWEEQDPSVEYLMTQSAPLMVPLRPNASLGATVF